MNLQYSVFLANFVLSSALQKFEEVDHVPIKSAANATEIVNINSNGNEATSGWMICIYVVICLVFVGVLGESVYRSLRFYRDNFASKKKKASRTKANVVEHAIWGRCYQGSADQSQANNGGSR